MANMTPVYYLQSGQMKFWQEEGTTSSAAVITPNAIVAKKQSQAAISYDPYKKQTVVAVYKGEAEVADLSRGKKMLVKPADEGKPRIAIISSASVASSSKPAASSASTAQIQSNSGATIGVLITAGIIGIFLGYIILRKKSYLAALYSKIKQKMLG